MIGIGMPISHIKIPLPIVILLFVSVGQEQAADPVGSVARRLPAARPMGMG